MQQTRHRNSRKVRLMRASNFLAKAQGDKEVVEYLASASQAVGSYWESSGSRRIASGMSIKEEKLLLPDLLGLHPEDREYFEKRNNYFAGIETKVPPKEGLELEIGLEMSNDAELSADNLPINVADYIIYRHALKHPWVALSADEANGNQLKHYYIHDEVGATDLEHDKQTAIDEALEYYLQVKKNPEKVNMMLTLLGVDYRDIVGQTEEQAKQLRLAKLRSLVDTSARDIVKLKDDKDVEIKYDIQMMLNTGVMSKIGVKYLIAETGVSLGKYEEVVQFFKDKDENSDTIAILKAKVQEATKAGRRAPKTRR